MFKLKMCQIQKKKTPNILESAFSFFIWLNISLLSPKQTHDHMFQ